MPISDLACILIFISGVLGIPFVIVWLSDFCPNNKSKYGKMFPNKKDKERYICYRNFENEYDETLCPGRLNFNETNIDSLCKDCSHYEKRFNYLTEDNDWFKKDPKGFEIPLRDGEDY